MTKQFVLTEAERQLLHEKLEKYSMPMPPSTCKMWIAGTQRGGYGEVWIPPHGMLGAHRAAFLLAYGWLPPEVRHECDTPICIEPTHLIGGTHLENMRDMAIRNRSARGDRHGTRLYPERRPRGDIHGARLHPESVPKGEWHPHAIFTEKDIIEIRNTTEAVSVLVREYKCSRSAIYDIRYRRNWKHIP